MTITIDAVRKRAHHYLEPSIAGCANMTLDEMKQFLAGTYYPDADQLHQLALRMKLYPEPAR